MTEQGGRASAGSSPVVGGRTLEVFARTPRLNRWLFSKLRPHIQGNVLEIGSGIGNLSRLIRECADTAVFSDTEAPYLGALQGLFGGDPQVTIARYDLDRPPPPAISSRRFDAIVAVNVLEHIEDDAALAGTLAGLLEPGGKLAVYVPACPAAYGSLDRALGHHRRYTPATLTSLLGSAGLEAAAPRYVNLAGLLGWMLTGRILRRDRLSALQIAAFERLLPIVQMEDRVRLPIGLGLYTTATRRGGQPRR